MSRAVLGGVVAFAIAVLTATAYLVATAKLEDRIRQDLRARVLMAQDLLVKNAELDALRTLKRAEELALDPLLARALAGEERARPELAEQAFQRFRALLPADEPRPGILAVVNARVEVVALVSQDRPVLNPMPDLYRRDGAVVYRALELALASTDKERQIITEIWDYEGLGPVLAAAAPIAHEGNIVGAIVIAYPITVAEANRQRDGLLGAEVAYFHGGRVYATSLGGRDVQAALSALLFENGLAKEALESPSGMANLATFTLGGREYVGATGRLPRFSTHPDRLPGDYPPVAAGALVAMSVGDALAPLTTIRLVILLLGVGAILVAILAMVVTARTVLGPLDEIELGINEIINGNLERTFRPGGPDVEGLANSLNVMLARLLGRPEPGEEEYDEEGNLVRQASGLAFDQEELSPRDAEALELAREPEEAYYARLYEEFRAARAAAGESVDGMTREGFVAKLRLNEATLKEKYRCQSVRFKVVTRDGQVILKPVPIA